MVSKPSIWLPLFDEFIQNLRINSKEESTADGSGTKLELWESQRRFMQEVAHGLDRGVRTFYCLKSRQLGITTVSLAIDIFWMALNPGMTGALVTENEANRDKNRKVLKQYIESFPEGYFGDKFGIKSDNRNAMSFTNGSRLDFKVAGTKDKGTSWAEGEGYAYAHLTETAAYGSADGLRSFEEAFAQVNPKRLFLYESTAKGFGLWRDTWLAGKQDPYTKHSFFIGWWASATNRIERSDPRFAEFGRDKPDAEERERIKQVRDLYGFEVIPEQLAWYRWRDDNPSSDEGVMAQNQPWTADDAFVTSGQSFFQTRQVSKDITVITDNPDSYAYLAYAYEYGATFFDMRLHVLEDEDDPREIELKVWEEPVIGGRYVIGCDPAYGRTDHGDAIAIEVYRCYADKLVQVAEYCTAQVEVKYAAWTLAHLAGAYSNCIVNLEIYGGGSVILNEWDNLRQMIGSGNYDGAVRAGNWEDALNNARWYLYNRPDSMGAGYAIGFNCLALDTLLPTPTGWTTMGEVCEGDYILSDTGLPTKVLGVSPVKVNAKCYELEFDDGTKIVADEDHWWKVARRHWKDGDKLRQTRQLEAKKFYIRPTAPLLLPEVELPIDPYPLGLWLGDGFSGSGRMACGSRDVDELCELIEACGQPTTRYQHPTCWNIGFSDGTKARKKSFRWRLQGLGLLNNKHIPAMYLRASFEQRLSLLQGLMDSDGHASSERAGKCNFVTTLPALRDGFSELIRSLGFKSKHLSRKDMFLYRGNLVPAARRYQFWLTSYPEMPIFRLQRKIDNLYDAERKRHLKANHRIKSIREIDTVPVRCVMVDSPTKMFLAGEGMIPTHNTTHKAKMELMYAMRGSYTTRELEIRSVRMLNEMNMVVQEGQIIGAPESRDINSKDDRVFASAFAHRAWVDWRRKEMMAENATYERITAEENGTASKHTRSMNGMVERFFAHQALLAGSPGRVPTWRAQRGLE